MRLIDADALEKYLSYKIKEYSVKDDAISQCMKTAYTLAFSSVNGAPELDAVEVVRCEDCIHSVPSDNGYKCKMLASVTRIDLINPSDFYCKDGRREIV